MSTTESYHEFNILTPAKVLRADVPLTRLGHLNQWVAWKWGLPRPNGKHTKVPINPLTGKEADVTDSGTWASFSKASEAVERYGHAGVGFVFTREDPYCGVDLDNCIASGEVAPWAMEIVEALDSYTELSPSGTGLKIWVEASKSGERCKTGDFEMYDRKHFFTFTGERFAGGGVEERQDELTELYRRMWPAPPEHALQDGTGHPRSSDSILLDDFDLLEKARASSTGRKFEALYDSGNPRGEDHSRSDYELCKMLAFWCGKDAEQMERLFSGSALGQRGKWKNRKDYRRRTIERACKAVSKVYDSKHGQPQQTTREQLQHRMAYALWGHQWREKAGRADAAATDYSSYRAMLWKAYKANKETIGMSERELCEVAGLGARQTASGSLRRLEDKHRLLVKVGSGGKDGAATYRLKPVNSQQIQSLIAGLEQGIPKLGQELISKNITKGTSLLQTCVYNVSGSLLGGTLGLRNSSPEMPDYDKNGRKIPKGKQAPVERLGKVCGWILDLVHVAETAVPVSFLSERTGIARNHLAERYLNNMVVAGFIKETEEGYVSTTNVRQALRDELEDSGCNDAAKLQRERHDRDREAYSKRKNEKPDRAPTEEEMDAIREQRDSEDSDFEDFDGIELKPLLTPLAIACREYLERNPSRRNETPSWLAGTLWAYELYPGKPTRYEVAVALEELVGNRSLIKFA